MRPVVHFVLVIGITFEVMKQVFKNLLTLFWCQTLLLDPAVVLIVKGSGTIRGSGASRKTM